MDLGNAAAARAQRDSHAGRLRLPAGLLLPVVGQLAVLVQLLFIGRGLRRGATKEA